MRLPADSRSELLEQRFADLRSSATLTRGGVGAGGWRFSHNSVREYLAAEFLIEGLTTEQLPSSEVPITDAMRMFVASMQSHVRENMLKNLSRAWKEPRNIPVRGQNLSLLWDGFVSLIGSTASALNQIIKTVAGAPADFRSTRLTRLNLSSELNATTLHGADFSSSELSAIELTGADLSAASFRDATIENVNFSTASLKGTSFCGALIVDCEFTGAELGGADFSRISPSDISIYLEGHGLSSKLRLQGSRALGYLKFGGTSTDAIPDIFVVCNYPSFIVVDKIIEKLGEQAIRQRRGLEQRGAARRA